jgi:putative hydrolase of the HAD superfamily
VRWFPGKTVRCAAVPDIRAVLFDFGGVISTSPFEGFARYERENDLPEDFLRRLNATNPDANAWARHERAELSFDDFCVAYEAEAAALGHAIDAREVFAALSGELRPQMLEAIRRCRERLRTGLITNNVKSMAEGDTNMMTMVDGLFDVVIESSKTGVRKPDPRIYEMACAELGVAAPHIAFLDDLGINLKPAAAMGMTTIKVVDPDEAIAALADVVGFPLC